jgi:hypothetical protein
LGKKIKDSRGFYLIINGFIIVRLDKIRLSWAIPTSVKYGSRAERKRGAPPSGSANEGSSRNRLVELFAAYESVKGQHRTSVQRSQYWISLL